MMSQKRKEIEDFILEVVGELEPSGYNTKIYKERFSKMNDKEFHIFMESLRDNIHAKLTLLVPPFKVVIQLENCFKAAKILGINFFKRLKLWDPISKRYFVTPEKYMILRLPVRRLKQYLYDGLSVPDSDRRLNPLTDQVVKPDKGSAISYPQAQMIAEKGLVTTLHELFSIRGGDLEAYSKMKAEIEETGYTTTSVMEGTAGVRSAQTLRTLLNAMHLKTNL